jgi:hypothetical protein
MMDAAELLEDLKVRLAEYKLALHPDKTRLIEFGKSAVESRRKKGEPKPETFDFLGFTHICAKARDGRRFKLLRRTIKKRFTAKLKALKIELGFRINWSISQVGGWLRAVLNGYYNYFAVPGNLELMGRFRYLLAAIWIKIIRRRSHKAKMTWEKFTRIIDKWLPRPRAKHPYPNQRCRFDGRTAKA